VVLWFPLFFAAKILEISFSTHASMVLLRIRALRVILRWKSVQNTPSSRRSSLCTHVPSKFLAAWSTRSFWCCSASCTTHQDPKLNHWTFSKHWSAFPFKDLLPSELTFSNLLSTRINFNTLCRP
jgi:hypothetical protein